MCGPRRPTPFPGSEQVTLYRSGVRPLVRTVVGTSRILDHCLDEWNTGRNINFASRRAQSDPASPGLPRSGGDPELAQRLGFPLERSQIVTQSMETATTLRETSNFIGGEWAAASSGATYEVSDPFSAGRRRSARLPARATTRAARSRLPPLPSRSGRRLRPRSVRGSCSEPPTSSRAVGDEVVDLLARETGATLRLRHVPDAFRPRACCARRRAPCTRRRERSFPRTSPGSLAMGLRHPVGVVGAIAPWNAALILSLRRSRADRARQHGGAEAVRVVADLGRHALG